MALIHVFTTPLIEELERQEWTWDGSCIQVDENKLVVALGVKTDKPIFVDVRWNEDTLSFDTLTQETTDDGAIITEHDNGVSIKDIAEHIVDLQKVQKLDTDAIMALMLEEIKEIEG